MSLEIERKFLVIGKSYRERALEVHIIHQAYICREPDRTVRVRIFDNQGFITIKTRNKGTVRNEWEYEIPVDDARYMIGGVCHSGVISKHRYVIDAGNGLRWEVDEFDGSLSGTILAEIELPDENTPFELPDFIGEEVTDDPRYFNSALSTQV